MCQKFICLFGRAYPYAWAADGAASLPIPGWNASSPGLTRSRGAFVTETPGRGHRPLATSCRNIGRLIAKQTSCRLFPPHCTFADKQTQDLMNVLGCASAWSAEDRCSRRSARPAAAAADSAFRRTMTDWGAHMLALLPALQQASSSQFSILALNLQAGSPWTNSC